MANSRPTRGPEILLRSGRAAKLKLCAKSLRRIKIVTLASIFVIVSRFKPAYHLGCHLAIEMSNNWRLVIQDRHSTSN